VVEASVTGVFKTVLIIIGAFVLLRFLGQLMIAKRNMEEERKLNEQQRKADKERADMMKKFGKTSILSKINSDKRTSPSSVDVQDVEFEEIKD
jgi:uncharacterized membrane-anchored protein YhcB (DUF1043 family)